MSEITNSLPRGHAAPYNMRKSSVADFRNSPAPKKRVPKGGLGKMSHGGESEEKGKGRLLRSTSGSVSMGSDEVEESSEEEEEEPTRMITRAEARLSAKKTRSG
ncbi:hypothetical protein HDU98_000958, partial [Podochytrium sp. JEL0797]